MAKQFITLSRHNELVIETPAGLIRVSWTGKGHRLAVEMPDGMVAHRSVERALAGAQFLAVDQAGRIIPKYRMLMPATDGQGVLTGVQQPPVYRIAKTG